MSNFFRDSALGFKVRPNLFTKLRVPEAKPQHDAPMDISLLEEESNSSLITMFDKNDNTNTHNRENKNVDNTNEFGDDLTSQTMMNDMKPYMGASTPKVKPKEQPNSRIHVDDDFEITEVREITPPKKQTSILHNAQGQLLETPTKIRFNNVNNESVVPKATHSNVHNDRDTNNFNLEPNSNDVLLEAFTNTQRICSNLKQEVQVQRSENTKLKSILKNYQVDIKKINEKMDHYKTLLNSLQETSTTLSKQKTLTDENVTKLTKDHTMYKQKIQTYNEEITTLKTNFSKLNELKREISIESSKKDKEIEYLKRELDDCSGQLSEEKIKNSSLINDLNQVKKELLDYMEEKLPQNESNVINSISKLENKLVDTLNNELRENSIQNNEIIKLEIMKQLQLLQQKYLSIERPFKTYFTKRQFENTNKHLTLLIPFIKS